MFILDNDSLTSAADIAAANFSIVDEMVDLHESHSLRTHGVGVGLHLRPVLNDAPPTRLIHFATNAAGNIIHIPGRTNLRA